MIEHIRREILTYCAALPQAILMRGPAEIGNVTLTLGNCFNWIAADLDGPKPQIEQVLGQSPQSIFALARQLQWVGRDLYDRQKDFVPPGPSLVSLQAEVARLDKLVHRLAAGERRYP